MLEAASISTPLAVKEYSASIDYDLVDATVYRNIVGALQYLTVTCIEITYAINHVCQFMQARTTAYLHQVK